MKTNLVLSKSAYMLGMKCPKYLWMYKHTPDKIPEPDKATENRFEQGYLVGEYAQKLFIDGIEIKTDNYSENIKNTKKALEKRKPVFEAGIETETPYGRIYSRADILEPVEKDKWDIIEVKSGTKAEKEHISDVAFQKFCYEKAGLKIKKLENIC